MGIMGRGPLLPTDPCVMPRPMVVVTICCLTMLTTTLSSPMVTAQMATTSTDNRSQSNVDYVSTYYGASNYHRWLTDQYPLLNISDKKSFEYQLLVYATLERNLTEEIIEMLGHELRSLCVDLNPQCESPTLYTVYTLTNLVHSSLHNPIPLVSSHSIKGRAKMYQ